MTAAARVVSLLARRGHSISAAESLTGGLVCASLVDVPGASNVVSGAVVAYTAQAKIEVLGISAELIAAQGTVAAQVALALAQSVRSKFGSTYGIGTTGVAGPGPFEGKPAGTVFVGFAGPDESVADGLQLQGSRAEIRHATVVAALSLVAARLKEQD